jgi:uncharacterized protein YuzE
MIEGVDCAANRLARTELAMQTKLQLTYDPEADALYLSLRPAAPADSVDYEAGVTLDLDAEGNVIGVEILDASERLDREAVKQLAAAMRSTAAA